MLYFHAWEKIRRAGEEDRSSETWGREVGDLSLGPCIPPFPIVTVWPPDKECSVDENSELVPTGTQVAGAEDR